MAKLSDVALAGAFHSIIAYNSLMLVISTTLVQIGLSRVIEFIDYSAIWWYI